MAAEYRSVHTEMWQADDWFQTLPTDARLLWIYLFTNPSASVSGIYKLPLRTMANETGLDLARVTELLAEFKEAKKAYYQDGIIWVRKMRDYQLPGKISDKLVTHLNKEIAKIPDGYLKREYLIAYGYRIDTHSKPVDTVSIPRATDTDTDTDTETILPTPFQAISGNGSGRSYAEKMQALNNKLGPELRRELADAILKITGQYELANTETDAGTKALYEAHEAAVAVHQMGYKTAEDLMAPEDDWYANDFRGKRNERPTQAQFLTQASKCKADPREVKPFAVEEWR